MSDTEHDSVLLTRFVREGDDDAFRGLVTRHTTLVYRCAVQRLRDPHAAADVTQAVFVALALKAKSLSPGTSLPGWLYKATRFACAKYQRGEQRRKERDMHAVEQRHLAEPDARDAVWREVEPHLAAALDSLSERDREAVLLRFYGQATHRDVGVEMGLTEEAAKKRVNRALEKLLWFFTKRGVTLSSVALGGLLAANTAQAAPVGLAVAAYQAALPGVSGTLTVTHTVMLAKGTLKMMLMSQVKFAAAVVAATLVVAGSGVVVAQKVETSHKESAETKQEKEMKPTIPVVPTGGRTAMEPVAAQDAVVKEIRRLEDAWAAAEVKKDGAAVGQLMTEDFLFTGPDGALLSKPQLIQVVSTSNAERISEIGSDYQVKVYGDTAVIHGIVTIVDKVKSGTKQERLRFTDTWVKQADGNWLCVAAQSAIITGGKQVAEQTDIAGSVFNDVNLAGATFENVNLSKTTFENVNMSKIQMHDINLSDLDLSAANLGGAHIKHTGPAPDKDGKQARQKAVTFEEAMLCDSTFRKVDLSNVKIIDCDIQGMTIDGILVTDVIAAYKNQKK